MCGIVGHFARDVAALEPETLFDLIDCLLHRGPHDSTWWQHGRY